MKILNLFIALLLLSSANLFAQFSIETFLDAPFDQTIASVKESHPDKKFEEKHIRDYQAVMYYDWLDPVSVKVGYLFSKEGVQKGKVITNGKESEADAQKLYELSKNALIGRYGTNFSENSMLGITMVTWYGTQGYMVMLSRKGSETSVMILNKK